MKYMIASDIHGSAWYCRKMMEALEKEQADRLILLGDLLYHGPRNDLPKEYAPKEVIRMLNKEKNRIYNVRGNCDAEVDQMVLPFNILDERKIVEVDGRRILLHHGHHETDTSTVSVVMSGHTHVPVLEEKDGVLYLNPGSTTIPKNGSRPSYAVWDDGRISIIGLDDGHIVKEWK